MYKFERKQGDGRMRNLEGGRKFCHFSSSLEDPQTTLYIFAAQHSSHLPHVTTEHVKCGWSKMKCTESIKNGYHISKT